MKKTNTIPPKALLSLIGEHGAELIIIVARDMTLRYVGAAVERLLDRKAAEIVAAGTKGLFTEEGIDDIGALMKLRGRGRSSAARVMLHLRSARGSAIPCEGRAADHRNDPTVEGLVLVLHDMRPKQELAGAYDQSSNDVEVLLGHTGEALFLVDTTFCLRAFNRVAAVRTKRWLGKELKAGMSIYDLARPERKAGLEAVYARVLAGEELSYPLNLTGAKDGPHLELHYRPTRSQGRVDGIFVEARDITARTIADRALKEREADLRALVDNIPEVFWSMDLEGRLVTFNKAFERFIKRSDPSDVVRGIVVRDRFPEKDRSRFQVMAERVLQGEQVQWVESYQGSTIKYFEVTANPIRNEEGVVGVSVLARDITFRITKEAEVERLRTLAELTVGELEQVLECSSDLICSFDPQGMIVRVNAASYSVLGYLPEEMMGRHYGEFIIEDDRRSSDTVADQVLEGERVLDFENRWRHKAGHAVPLLWSATLDRGSGLRYGIAMDLTVRKRLEAELDTSAARLRQTIEGITDGFFILDRDWRFVESNGITERASGIPRQQFIGRSIWEVFPRAQEDGFFAVYNKAMTERVSVVREIWESTAGVWLELRVVPVPEGIAVFYTDIGERKKAEQELLLANERYRLAANVAMEAHWDWDLRGNTVVWGEGFQTLFGQVLPAGLPADQAWESFIHEDDRQRVVHSIHAVIDSPAGINWSEHYRFYCGDGRIAWVQDRGAVIRDAAGKAIRMVGVMRDSTREHEEGVRDVLLAEASRRLNQAPDLGSGLAGMLAVLCSHTGHEVGELWMPDGGGDRLLLLGKFASDAQLAAISAPEHVADLSLSHGLPGAAFRTGHALIWNGLGTCPEFTRSAVAAQVGASHGMAIPLGYAGEAPMAIIVLIGRREPVDAQGLKELVADIGKGLAPAMARKRSQQELANFFDLTEDLLLVVDRDGFIRKANPAVSTKLGFTLDRVVGTHVVSFVHPDDAEASMTTMWAIVNGAHTPNFEHRIHDAQGQYHWYAWSTSVPDAEGLIYCVGKDISARKADELHLTELTERLTTFQESITDALYIVDRQWHITYVNAEAERIFQRQRGELLGSVLWEVMRDHQGTVIRERFEQCMTTGGATHFETFYREHSCWYEIHAYPSSSGLSVFFRDVTDSRIVHRLQDLERKALADNMDGKHTPRAVLDELLCGIDALLPGMHCSILTVDEGGHVLNNLSGPGLPEAYNQHNVNVPVEEGHGSCGTAAARRQEVFSTDIANDPIWRNYREIALANGLRACWSYPVLATNGRLLGTFANYFTEPRKPGPLEKLMAERVTRTVANILEAELVQEMERTANERYQLVSRATEDATWDWDLRTGHWEWGEGYRNRFGYDPAEQPATIASWQDHLHPDDAGRVMHGLRKVLRNPELNIWVDEYRFLRADGSVAFVLDRGFVSRDAHGAARRMVGAMQDITDRKEKELALRDLNAQLATRAHELQVSNTELERFAFVASHDLQEPLRMITSFLQLLERRLNGLLDDKSREYLRFAVDGSQRMKQLILDLLEYSRVGSTRPAVEEVDMERVVAQVGNIYMEQVHRTGARIETVGLPKIQADTTRMIQLMQNLIGNALRYRTDDPPVIRVECEDLGGHWAFHVADNGIGIEEGYFDKIFIIFQRLHVGREDSATGIGLTICRRIVELHGGRIWVDSVPGKGSTFHFTIAKPVSGPLDRND